MASKRTPQQRLDAWLAAHAPKRYVWAAARSMQASTLSKIIAGERLPTLEQAIVFEAECGIPAREWAR